VDEDREHGSPPPSEQRRWDTDERGRGVADARPLAPRVGELQRAAEAADWVAEQPDAHLWPHLEQAIEAPGSNWASASYAIDDDGMLVVDLVHVPVEAERTRGELLADVMRLLGTVIEGATFIEVAGRRSDDSVEVDVVTGMLEDQTPFLGHGHTIRLRARVG
jgi:hypothetical protein